MALECNLSKKYHNLATVIKNQSDKHNCGSFSGTAGGGRVKYRYMVRESVAFDPAVNY